MNTFVKVHEFYPEVSSKVLHTKISTNHPSPLVGAPLTKTEIAFIGLNLNPKPLLAASSICHMKTRRGKTWKISSQTVMSGRHRVDTQGCCSVADPLIEMVASLDRSMQSLWFITIGYHPMCVYPLSTQQHHT